MWMQAGFSVLKGLTGYIQSSREASYRQKLQDYNNKMVSLANAQNQNALVTNQNLAVERSLAQQFEISRSEYVTLGKVETSAAASGTEGRSVNQTLYQVQRSADEAESRRMADLDAQLAQIRQQSLNSAMQANQQIDQSYIPQPSPVTAMLGIGTSLLRNYYDYSDPKSI